MQALGAQFGQAAVFMYSAYMCGSELEIYRSILPCDSAMPPVGGGDCGPAGRPGSGALDSITSYIPVLFYINCSLASPHAPPSQMSAPQPQQPTYSFQAGQQQQQQSPQSSSTNSQRGILFPPRNASSIQNSDSQAGSNSSSPT